MIYINPNNVHIPLKRQQVARKLTKELQAKQAEERAEFIKAKRGETWGHDDLVDALRNVAGNKCWYCEVMIDGADPEIDHFRPKGRVTEVDCESLEKTGKNSPGYWWLAFEPRNYRLSCQHSNQRRVDKETSGGKGDYFPVEGTRASENTEWELIAETVLPFDPCSESDVSLMWFGPDGTPALRKPEDEATPFEKRRMQVTVWLYHLNKREIATSRAKHVEAIVKTLKDADMAYKLWSPHSSTPNAQLKERFDAAVENIKRDISDTAVFAGAKRCAVQLAISAYPWIEEYQII